MICSIVESVGQGVTEFKEGDHVLTLFTGECMRCKHCTSAKSNMCQVLGFKRNGVMHSDQKTRFSLKGKPIYHFCAVSSFSEYTVVHSGCAAKISSIAPLERICLLSCGVSAGNFFIWWNFYQFSFIHMRLLVFMSTWETFKFILIIPRSISSEQWNWWVNIVSVMQWETQLLLLIRV